MPTKTSTEAIRAMRGRTKDEITKIQIALKGLGLLNSRADGIFGELSLAAVKKFQRINRLNVDGIVGPKTWNALFPPRMADRDLLVNPPAPIIKPAVTPLKNPWPRQRDVQDFYGKVGENQTLIELPYPMVLAWDKRKTVKKISLHEKVADSAFQCLDEIEGIYGKDIPKLGLNIFGGSLNVRKMRGGNSWSMHSWGIAIDFDPANNLLKWNHTKATLAKDVYIPFWQVWEKHGWLSLGRARDYDWMHVQAAQL